MDKLVRICSMHPGMVSIFVPDDEKDGFYELEMPIAHAVKLANNLLLAAKLAEPEIPSHGRN